MALGTIFRGGKTILPKLWRAGVPKTSATLRVVRSSPIRENAARAVGYTVAGTGAGAGLLGLGYFGAQGVEAVSGSMRQVAQDAADGTKELLEAPGEGLAGGLSALFGQSESGAPNLLLPAALIGGAIILSKKKGGRKK